MRRAALTLILALGSALLPEAAFTAPVSAEAVTAPAPAVVRLLREAGRFDLEPPSFARARTSALRPLLRAHVPHARRVRLACGAQRACSSLSLSPAWSALLPARAIFAQESAAARSSREPAPVPRSPRGAAFSVGKRVTLKSGRELSVQLTPTPLRCAPLFSVTY